ncbi:MAG: hypothetical protein KAJ19_23125 [Gammaproteobacteria bacterium]|nr:hypothetical protein [Gammaproteobacteria bacterium]
MITDKNITGLAVLAITVAGESGSCWMNENNTGAAGQADVRIYHTDAGAPSIATVRASGKKLYKSNGNDDVMIISADNVADIHYAVCNNDDDTATIHPDVS